MRTKMTIPAIAVATMAMGCISRPYNPAGGPGPLHVAGFYDVSEELYSTDCGPVATRKDLIRVEVQHPAGALTARIIVDHQPLDAQIRPDGNFTVRAWQSQQGQTMTTTTISGRFSDSTFYARVNVSASFSRSSRDARPPGCSYQLRWSAKKL